MPLLRDFPGMLPQQCLNEIDGSNAMSQWLMTAYLSL
jgi:hypothetical protein